MKKVVKFGINPKMMVPLSIVVVVAVAAVARAESEAELAYSPEELQGRRNALKVCFTDVHSYSDILAIVTK